MARGLRDRLIGPFESMPPGRGWLIVSLLLLAASFLLRARHFGNPAMHVDEQFYLLVGDRMLDGSLPFVDLWDRKPAGLFLIFAAIRLLGGTGVLEYQVVATLFAAATALLVARLAARFAPLSAALVSGFLYLLWLNIAGGEGGQAPVFYNLPVAVAALLTLAALGRASFDGRAFALGTSAMLLAGLALQIKYSALFEGIFFGIALLWGARRGGRRWTMVAGLAIFWVLLALLPTLAAYFYYASIGHGEAFLHANFQSTFDREQVSPLRLALRLLLLFGLLVPLLLAGLFARLWGRPADPAAALAQDFTLCWAAAAIAGVLLFGTYFHHYALALLPPLAAAAAPAFAIAGSKETRPHRARLAMVLLIPAIGLVGQEISASFNARERGSPAAFHRTADWLRQRMRPGECIYVHDGDPLLYHYSRSCLVTRWSFTRHLDHVAERNALGVDQLAEIRRIMERARPRFVLVNQRPRETIFPPVRRYLLRELRENYRPARAVPVGTNLRIIYERRASPGRD